MKFTKMKSLLMVLLLLLVCIPAMAIAENAEVQEITVPNTPIRGVIRLEKTGPVLNGFNEHQDPFGYTVHTPLYGDGWLEGAVFEIRAVEDIIGKDGTLWFKADEVADTVTTTADKTAESKLLPLGHYYLTEISAPEGYIFDSTRYDVVLESRDQKAPVVTVNVTARNDYMPARISMIKEKEVITTETDHEGMVHTSVKNAPGEGFVFGLYNSDSIVYAAGELPHDTLIATAISDKEGKISFSGKLPCGKYYIQELSGPEGWILSNSPYEIELTDAARTVDNELVIRREEPIVNKLLHTEVCISKTDVTGDHYLPHTLIEVKNAAGETVLKDYTGEDGYLPPFSAVPGVYTYREVLAPEGYELSTTELTFTVNKEGQVEGQTKVSDDYTRFMIRKEDQRHQPLPGVEFGLFREDGTQQAKAVSDENGIVTFEKIPYGSYTIQEIKALAGYLKNTEKVSITIDGTFVNPEEPIATLVNEQTEILIRKESQNGTALSGAEFGLYNKDGKLVMTAVSDNEGRVRFVGADYSKYTIRELTAPKGYLLNHDVITVSLDEGFSNPEKPLATVVDQEKKIMCIKTDTAGNPIAGIEFTLINASTMEAVETAVSDKNGAFTFHSFDYGEWIIHETAAPEGFMKMEGIRFHVDDSWTQPDPIMCVNIPNHYEFLKTDSSSNPMAGVKFRLEDEEGKELGIYESGEDGIVRIENLNRGTYIIREIETLEGYSVTGEVITLKLDEYFVLPEKMKQVINYTNIQTGVHMAVTGVMWVGLALMVVSGTVGVIKKRKARKAN